MRLDVLLQYGTGGLAALGAYRLASVICRCIDCQAQRWMRHLTRARYQEQDRWLHRLQAEQAGIKYQLEALTRDLKKGER